MWYIPCRYLIYLIFCNENGTRMLQNFSLPFVVRGTATADAAHMRRRRRYPVPIIFIPTISRSDSFVAGKKWLLLYNLKDTIFSGHFMYSKCTGCPIFNTALHWHFLTFFQSLHIAHINLSKHPTLHSKVHGFTLWKSLHYFIWNGCVLTLAYLSQKYRCKRQNFLE